MRPQQPPVASKVFIQRDYSSGTKCQFQTKFPPELENRGLQKLWIWNLKSCIPALFDVGYFLLGSTPNKFVLTAERKQLKNQTRVRSVCGNPFITVIDRQQFEETVRTLNNLYAEAEKLGSHSYLEGCLACLTAYTIFLCMETHYEKVLKKIAKYVQEQNEKIYAPQGLLLTDPIERGLRVIEITIYEDRSVTSGR